MTSALPVAVALSGLQMLIGVIGFRSSVTATWWLVERLPSPCDAGREGLALAEARARGIAAIANRLLSRPRCLPRALLLSALLRRRRMSATLCLGARADGAFDAHAWVEIDGRPVNEAADLQATYSCLWRGSVLDA